MVQFSKNKKKGDVTATRKMKKTRAKIMAEAKSGKKNNGQEASSNDKKPKTNNNQTLSKKKISALQKLKSKKGHISKKDRKSVHMAYKRNRRDADDSDENDFDDDYKVFEKTVSNRKKARRQEIIEATGSSSSFGTNTSTSNMNDDLANFHDDISDEDEEEEEESPEAGSSLKSSAVSLLNKVKSLGRKALLLTAQAQKMEEDNSEDESEDDVDFDDEEEEEEEVDEDELDEEEVDEEEADEEEVDEEEADEEEVDEKSEEAEVEVEEEEEEEEEIENLGASGNAKQTKNKQRVLLLSSRGIVHRYRHLLTDLHSLMPHAKKDAKLDTKKDLHVLNEVAEIHNCNNCVFFEVRKHSDLYLWVAKTPNGPSVKFAVHNVHTMEELKTTGNCLKGSRPILSFDSQFDQTPHNKLIKELLTQSFGVPKTSRKIKPFFDHIYTFSLLEGKIWFRNYQIVEQPKLSETGKVLKSKKNEETEIKLVEIGPRFVLDPIRIFDGSFGGSTLYVQKSKEEKQ